MSRELAPGASGMSRISSAFAEIYSAAALQPIAAVNQQFLRLLTHPDFASYFSAISELLASSEEFIPHLIAACPFTLFDLRFRDATAWRTLVRSLPSDPMYASEYSEFRSVVNSATVLAWYAARRWPTEAPIFLGATDEVVRVLQSIDLPQLPVVSIQHSDWLRPRWTERIPVWSELISLARNPKSVSDGTLRLRAMEQFLGDLIP